MFQRDIGLWFLKALNFTWIYAQPSVAYRNATHIKRAKYHIDNTGLYVKSFVLYNSMTNVPCINYIILFLAQMCSLEMLDVILLMTMMDESVYRMT